MTKTVFISWMPHNWRSQVLAEAVCARNYFVHYFKFKRARYAPAKYILQFFKTLSILSAEKPTAIIVATPPVFAAFAVYLYARIAKKPFMIDAHTGSFLDPKWRWSRGIHAFFSRRAISTIVTNDYLYKVVSGAWRGKALVIPGTIPDPEELPPGKLSCISMSGKLNVAVPCSFSGDEPIAEILEAAEGLEDQVTLYITGDSGSAAPNLVSRYESNVILTGFLSRKEYSALLHSVDAIMVLTKRDHTMQLGGYEAVAVAKPLITSDWDVLKKYFSQGTLYVDNTPEDIRAKLRLLLSRREYKRLVKEMKSLKCRRTQEWEEQARYVRRLLEGEVQE